MSGGSVYSLEHNKEVRAPSLKFYSVAKYVMVAMVMGVMGRGGYLKGLA